MSSSGVREVPLTLGATRYGLMLYNAEDGCAGRGFAKYGEYSEAEVEIFRQYRGNGRLALDIGANIGAHSLAMARIFDRVHSFEANSTLAAVIAANMALNGLDNVIVHGGPAQDSLQGLVFSDPLDFVKIDVDGPELEILGLLKPRITADRPILYFENDAIDRSEAKLAWLIGLPAYRSYWHLAGLYGPGNWIGAPIDDCDAGNASMMMLAVPEERPQPQGLKVARVGDTTLVMTRHERESGETYLTFDLSGLPDSLGVTA